MKLDQDFADFIEALRANDVRFMIVGGYALAAHGAPRATGDIDVWVLVSSANAARVVAATEEFGFGSLGLTEDDFTEPNRVIQLGFPPFRIDILTSIDGVEFDEAWDNRIQVDTPTGPIDVIGREELIANKRAAGRLQDLADVERLTQPDEPR